MITEFKDKLIERLEEEKDTAYKTYATFEMKVDLGRTFGIEKAIEIINQLAEEYKADTKDGHNDFISRNVLIDKLQKWKLANEERGYDTAKDLVQEMIDLVKEQPSAPYKPPVSDNIPTWKQNIMQKFERID